MVMTRTGYSGKVMIIMRYPRIDSAANRHVRKAIQIREKRTKFRRAAFLVEGPHLLEMAANSGAAISEVFVTELFMRKKQHQGFLRSMERVAGAVYEVNDRVMDRITDTGMPQGIAAVATCRPVKPGELILQQAALIVVIDGIQDPGNLGTIIRTADAAGADAVFLLHGTCDAFMPKAIRATAGSIFNVPIVSIEEDVLIAWLREKRIQLAITAADAENDIYSTDLTAPLAIAFGNEARGVSSRLKQVADLFLRIPIFGKAESLNVATSAAICLYETIRQRQK